MSLELQPYDLARGECFRHPVEHMREARKSVKLTATETKHIERNKRNYQVKKVLG